MPCARNPEFNLHPTSALKIRSMQTIYALSDEHLIQLHQLYQQEWWSETRTLEDTRRGVQGSQLRIGLVDEQDALIGFARVLTDYTFKAFIFDLIVRQDQRAQGIGKQLIACIKTHEKLSRVQHFELYCLPEMFDFYAQQGFTAEVGGVRLLRYST